MTMQLKDRKIVLGICGGIAAYKTCQLCRLLISQGACVHVVMTKAASKLVSKTTLETLSGHKVTINIFDDTVEIDHISLGSDADLMVIAPATANTIAKLANGFADNSLTATALAAACPIVVAPAMNSRMYRHAATQQNLQTLASRGTYIITPASGPLACGEVGEGRMREPEEILAYIIALLNKTALPYTEQPCLMQPGRPLELTQTKLLPKSHGAGFKVLITAGPTVEPIDPVRFITNKSSGKMGYALARACYERGAYVTIVSGPVDLKAADGISVVKVQTAGEMHQAVMSRARDYDIVIGCAAVADFSVENAAALKIKKEDDVESINLKLVKNKDIISDVGHITDKRPYTVGFAAETDHHETNARAKIDRKNLDLIVLNDVSASDVGFNSDDNAVSIYDKAGKIADLSKASKEYIAGQIVDLIFKINRDNRK
ncbi:bifunctional phosphopantothenoylcysteine decarboxylase/phosphopantothenate--cysteine ligase CoaBC [Anaerobiospirillum thomasii]|uniref:Coenzyme A biosynthesis bifunctional protein CoaBC n=2 Tax=Anaerobiospirillum thomasii TaxID=179995 RepID=A0A2X0WUC7_9GAMM|nr:DNA/pantothenate metabolism flavoprotein [Anaerobiospirillum thomasii]